MRFHKPTAVTLVFWILALSVSIASGTIRNYVYGVRDFNIGLGFGDPTADAPSIWRVLKALQKSERASSVRRRPITVQALAFLAQFVDFASHDMRCCWAAVTCGIYGLLRIGEISPSGPRKPLFKHWRSRGLVAVLKLSKSKSSQLKAVKLIFNAIPNWSCPISSMKYYFENANFSFSPNDYLWRLTDGSPLSRDFLISTVRSWCSLAGLEETDFNGISFRKGGALSLSLVGVGDHTIRAMGRWKGHCYDRYIENVVSVVRRAQLDMGALWSVDGDVQRFTADDLWSTLQ